MDKMRLDQDFARKAEEFEYASRLRAAELSNIEQQIDLARLKSTLEYELAAAQKVRGEIEASILEQTLKAQGIVTTERQKLDGMLVQAIVDKMPTIMQSMPVRNIGTTTVFQMGNNTEPQGGSAILGALGLSVVSIIREILAPINNVLHQGSDVTTSGFREP